MAEGLAPISSSRIAAGDIARHSFAIVRRGFDADEVRAYLQTVSRALETMEEQEQDLRAAVAEAEERAAHPVVDEATLTSSLGQHSAQILRHAHDEAARIVAEAQEEAAALLRETHHQAEELQMRTETASAERVVEVERLVASAEQEARAEQERILHEATAEQDRIRSEAAAMSEEVVTRAKEEGRTLLEQVQEARRRVLADLSSRRRALSTQIEQLRAARDEMAASVHGVRDKVDGILNQLDRSEDEARAAALAVGDQIRVHGHEVVDGEAAGEMSGADVTAVVTQVVGDEGDASTDPGAPANAPSVDELFARIRAGSDTDAPGGGAAATTQMPAATPAEAVTEAVVVVVAEGEDGGATAAAEAPDAVLGDEEAAPAGPDAEIIGRRDHLLTPITAKLNRTVKRTLGDDQNRMLDLLRSTPSIEAELLLGPEDAHLALFADAVRDQLGEAFAAGAIFGGFEAAGTPRGDAVEQAATGLARAVVAMLRRRIVDGSEEPGAAVGAAFREWRGQRVERLAGDAATHSFSAGVAAAAMHGSDGKVRWVVTSAGGCSDCEDNALAGALASSEVFPTGHAFPPAHSGCRCLVAPAGN
jgi:DivIVA domain-containing protein